MSAVRFGSIRAETPGRAQTRKAVLYVVAAVRNSQNKIWYDEPTLWADIQKLLGKQIAPLDKEFQFAEKVELSILDHMNF